MSRYYKADDVIRAIEEMQNGYNGWSDTFDKAQIIGVLEELPTIDIVRCKDCKFSKVYQADSRGAKCRVCKAYRHSRLTSDDGFCSDGERIEE